MAEGENDEPKPDKPGVELYDSSIAYIPFSVVWRAPFFAVRNIVPLIQTVWLLFVLSFGMRLFLFPHLPGNWFTLLALVPVFVLMNASFAAVIHRWIVADRKPKGIIPLRVGRAELIYSASILLLTAFVVAVFSGVSLLNSRYPLGNLVIPVYLAAIIVVLWVSVTLLLVFPHAAVHGKFRPRLSAYRMTGNFWMAFAIYLTLILLLTLGAGYLTFALFGSPDGAFKFSFYANFLSFPMFEAFNYGNILGSRQPSLTVLGINQLYGLFSETTLIAALSYIYRYAMR